MIDDETKIEFFDWFISKKGFDRYWSIFRNDRLKQKNFERGCMHDLEKLHGEKI